MVTGRMRLFKCQVETTSAVRAVFCKGVQPIELRADCTGITFIHMIMHINKKFQALDVLVISLDW